jgi:hypothetical protein
LLFLNRGWTQMNADRILNTEVTEYTEGVFVFICG